MPITQIEIALCSDFIYRESGIFIGSDKGYLLESRLRPVAQSLGIQTLQDLIKKGVVDHNVKRSIVDAITTNETYFFRDKKPFDLLKMKLVPELIELKRPINIWSAASSTGQEAYSIAITLKEILFDLTKYNIKIDGTDISSEAVSRANHGVYSSFEVGRGLDASKVSKHFTKVNNSFKINDDIRFIAQFRQFNLLSDVTPSYKYDIVLCRNVAIYFNQTDKRKLFEAIHRSLKPSGVLIVGSTESLGEYSDLFKKEMFHNIVYYIKS